MVWALLIVRPLTPGLAGGVGVAPLDLAVFCSPSLMSASTALSRFPFNPLRTVELRFSSGKPMSLKVASFDSSPSPEVFTFDPNTLEGLFTLGGEVSCPSKPPIPGDTGGVTFLGNVEDFCIPKPNRFVGFGGSGGGLSSTELELPVFDLVPGRESFMNTRCSYFCRMYLSIALSTSSTSIGICALTLRGLYVLLDSALPMRFMFYEWSVAKITMELGRPTSTWALSHLSILNDLTLDMCVPSLRWRAAHRMHKKIPSCNNVIQSPIYHTEVELVVRLCNGKVVGKGATHAPARPSCTLSVERRGVVLTDITDLDCVRYSRRTRHSREQT